MLTFEDLQRNFSILLSTIQQQYPTAELMLSTVTGADIYYSDGLFQNAVALLSGRLDSSRHLVRVGLFPNGRVIPLYNSAPYIQIQEWLTAVDQQEKIENETSGSLGGRAELRENLQENDEQD